jgi:sensor histidine kinase YesM
LNGKHWIEGKTAPSIRITQIFWQHPLFIAGLTLCILGVIGLFIHLRIRHIRREAKLKMEFNQRLAENEMKALRAQMNPHFMFNSLNSIKHYILKENKKDASRYLTKFSQLMRAILANSEHKLVSLEDELHALKLYLEIEAMRFNQEFQYTIVVDRSIHKSHVFIPPLLIQPFVENAIWHGLLPKVSERRLDIRIAGVNGSLEIRIEDNGIGRKAAALRNVARNSHEKSMGMKLTADRIALIKNMLDITAHIHLDDLEDGTGQPTGTRVTISIPRIDESVGAKEKFTS